MTKKVPSIMETSAMLKMPVWSIPNFKCKKSVTEPLKARSMIFPMPPPMTQHAPSRKREDRSRLRKIKTKPVRRAIMGKTTNKISRKGEGKSLPRLKKAPLFSTLVSVKWWRTTEIFSSYEICRRTMFLEIWSQPILTRTVRSRMMFRINFIRINGRSQKHSRYGVSMFSMFR